MNSPKNTIILQNNKKSKLSPSLPLPLSHKRIEKSRQSPAFTIVELLIVVVVIAILAAITIVAYNGITNRANQAALKTTVSTIEKTLKTNKVTSSNESPLLLTSSGPLPTTVDEALQANNLAGLKDKVCVGLYSQDASYNVTDDTSCPGMAGSGILLVDGQVPTVDRTKVYVYLAYKEGGAYTYGEYSYYDTDKQRWVTRWIEGDGSEGDYENLCAPYGNFDEQCRYIPSSSQM